MSNGDLDRTALGHLAELANALVSTARKPQQRELAQVVRAAAVAALARAQEQDRPSVHRAEPWKLLEHALEYFEPTASARGVKLISVIAPDTPLMIETSETALSRAMTKRIANALSIANAGTTVVVNVSCEPCVAPQHASLIVRVDPNADDPPLILEDVLVIDRPSDHTDTIRGAALIAESDDTVRDALANHARHLGFSVQLEASPDATLRALEARRFELAIVDADLNQSIDERITHHLGAAGTPTVVIVTRTALAHPIFVHHHAVLSRPLPWTRLEPAIEVALGRSSFRTSSSSTSDIVHADTPAPSRHGVRILVAEDSATNQRFMQRLLRHNGLVCDLAADGAEAIARCRETAYDLVFMDVRMPSVNGIAATRTIRRDLGPSPPIVALTAGSTDEERQQCEDVGMNDFLAKPIDQPALADVLMRFLG